MTERCRLCALDFEPDDDTTPGPPICGLCAGTVLGAVRLDIRPDRLLPGGTLAGLFNAGAVRALDRLGAERDEARVEVQRVGEAMGAKIAELRNEVAALEAARNVLAVARAGEVERAAEVAAKLVATSQERDEARAELSRERAAVVRDHERRALLVQERDEARGDHAKLWDRLAAALGLGAPTEGIDLVAAAAYHRRELETVKAALANEVDAKGVLTGEVAAIRGDLKRARERLHEAERTNEALAQRELALADEVADLRRQLSGLRHILEGRDQRITEDAELVEALRADVAAWRKRADDSEGTVAAVLEAAGLDAIGAQVVTLPEYVKTIRTERDRLRETVRRKVEENAARTKHLGAIGRLQQIVGSHARARSRLLAAVTDLVVAADAEFARLRRKSPTPEHFSANARWWHRSWAALAGDRLDFDRDAYDPRAALLQQRRVDACCPDPDDVSTAAAADAYAERMYEAAMGPEAPDQAPPDDDGPPPSPQATNPDTAFWSPFGTVRACRHCGVLVSGGPNACVACVRAAEAAEAKP